MFFAGDRVEGGLNKPGLAYAGLQFGQGARIGLQNGEFAIVTGVAGRRCQGMVCSDRPTLRGTARVRLMRVALSDALPAPGARQCRLMWLPKTVDCLWGCLKARRSRCHQRRPQISLSVACRAAAVTSAEVARICSTWSAPRSRDTSSLNRDASLRAASSDALSSRTCAALARAVSNSVCRVSMCLARIASDGPRNSSIVSSGNASPAFSGAAGTPSSGTLMQTVYHRLRATYTTPKWGRRPRLPLASDAGQGREQRRTSYGRPVLRGRRKAPDPHHDAHSKLGKRPAAKLRRPSSAPGATARTASATMRNVYEPPTAALRRACERTDADRHWNW